MGSDPAPLLQATLGRRPPERLHVEVRQPGRCHIGLLLTDINQLINHQAEKLNGRAAMVGYIMALFVDQLTGVGLVDQQESFFGKLLLHVAVFGILLVRCAFVCVCV